jgi:hypothetical protein
MRIVKYKVKHFVVYLPFSEFVKYIGEMSIFRNDPGLNPSIETRRVSKGKEKQSPQFPQTKQTYHPKL